jgi:hypothetical protein
LYIEGKPGSGKSTLTKYFRENLEAKVPNARSGVVADYFYSVRGTVSEVTHENMLRAVLHGILDQDETFFSHFQGEFRRYKGGENSTWPRPALQRVLSSLVDHPFAKKIYLVLDAMDESEEGDRSEMVKLLCGLSEGSRRCIIKIFLASRPLSELRYQVQPERHGIIRMQDENKDDISRFTVDFLEHDLKLTSRDLEETKDYIVKHAEGVFVWVHLIKEVLIAYRRTGFTRNDIIEYLKGLPKEIKELYKLILSRLEKGDPRDIRDGARMLSFALFARRPLKLVEFRHLLAISEFSDPLEIPSDREFRNNTVEDIESRVVHCGGGFLEVKGHDGILLSTRNKFSALC